MPIDKYLYTVYVDDQTQFISGKIRPLVSYNDWKKHALGDKWSESLNLIKIIILKEYYTYPVKDVQPKPELKTSVEWKEKSLEEQPSGCPVVYWSTWDHHGLADWESNVLLTTYADSLLNDTEA